MPLLRLINELENVRREYKQRDSDQWNAFRMFNTTSLLPWQVILLTIFLLVCMLVQLYLEPQQRSVGVVVAIIIALLVFNTCLVFLDKKKRVDEISKKILWLIQQLKELSLNVDDSTTARELQSYLSASGLNNMFNSPSHSFMLLCQNGEGEPLLYPASLVTTDDVISLCPGQTCPCQVQCAVDGCIALNKGEIFLRDNLACSKEIEDSHNQLFKFKVLESPVIKEIKDCLSASNAPTMLRRPKMMLIKNREKTIFYLIAVAIPILSIATTILSCVWFVLFKTSPRLTHDNETASLFIERTRDRYWFDLFFMTLVGVIFPVLPFILPMLWVFVYGLGEARTLLPALNSLKGDLQCNISTIDWLKLTFEVIFGLTTGDLLPHNASTFDTLGSLTVLCCINKEGLLSWYDPAPEKVFFFKQPVNVEVLSCESDEDLLISEEDENSLPPNEQENNTEILTISQAASTSEKLHFDDVNWEVYYPSLKAIGLNILVTFSSTSNKPDSALDKHENLYQKLLQHQHELECLSIEKSYISPGVLNCKRGLQMLTKLVGFAADVNQLYLPWAVRTVYKDNLGNPQCHRQHSLPLPHAHAVLVSHWITGQNYMLMAGSDDLVLEFCSHYWDGANIIPLNDSSRKKVADFCHRGSIVGHCVALSFIPTDDEYEIKGSSVANISKQSTSSSVLSSSQIFLGAVTMQHQTRIDTFHLIEALDKACIRFVHFSPEDEVRARVFAEKMGLEVGWNCHISLTSNSDKDSSKYSKQESVLVDYDVTEDDANDPSISFLSKKTPQTPQSGSSISESAFHSQNKAKLPCGVENIIPHIENVDNVPLLVPLFTNCNYQSSQKMVEIMQKYNEVVCCIGSSDDVHNMSVFTQADISIGLPPILDSHKESATSSSVDEDRHEADSHDYLRILSNSTKLMTCARSLNTFPCSVNLSHEESMATIFEMIKQARQLLTLTNVCLILYIKCLFMVSLVQLFSHILHLPAVFAPVDLFWLCYITIPCLSFSILGSPSDPDLMSQASLNNTSRSTTFLNIIFQNFTHFVMKFFPSCMTVLVIHTLGLHSSCQSLQNQNCKMDNTTLNSSSPSQYNEMNFQCFPQFVMAKTSCPQPSLAQAYIQQQTRRSQQIAMFALTLYMCAISSAYVHHWKLLKNRLVFTNKLWISTVLLLMLAQVVYSVIAITSSSSDFLPSTLTRFSLGKHEPFIWIITFLWTIPCLTWNEFVKWKEIKMWTRNQKRARLAFNTKLGMNSPF
ncbi:transmembrane protein 94-like isoform X2 [Clavelina lepadiformis]|uniref:transmembrane protein 94-like isoform X2 n=1 Tax=Clavelina lepadiformis TaxID=159417 RepID=UPI0040412D52